ncbi:MAG: hypothetical protein ABIH04_11080 [Planctomycetota bacterium]
MDGLYELLFIVAVVAISMIGGLAKKASENRARKRAEEERQDGRQPQKEPPPPQQHERFIYRQTKPPPHEAYPAQAAPPKQAQYNEEAMAQEILRRYREIAVPEVSREHATPSYDRQFKGDVAVGKVGDTKLVSNAIQEAGKRALSIDGSDLVSKEMMRGLGEKTSLRMSELDTGAVPGMLYRRRIFGPLKGTSLKRAVILSEILGSPKALQ